MNSLTKWLVIIIAILSAFICIISIKGINLHHSNNNWKHNYEVLQDSVNVIRTRNGELLFENGSLILNKKNLEEALDLSKKQIRDYEKTLGSNLAYISKLESELKIKDTIKITKIIRDTLSNSYSIHYDDSWLKFDEVFSLHNPLTPEMSLYNISMNVPLKVGIGDNYNIFVTSPNPYFNITSIEGAVIDGSQFAKKPQRLNISVYVGVGGQYGLINRKIDVGPQVGIGIGFRLF